MNFQNIEPGRSISLFVKNIWVLASEDPDLQTHLPFFADGHPGLIFQLTERGLTINPHKKQMPVLFLYGQTISPIELEMKGAYELIVFQLYPFVLKSFFNLAPRSLNDDCYDLQQSKAVDIPAFTQQLLAQRTVSQKIDHIANLLYQLFQNKKQNLDLKIKQAIESILLSKGQENIEKLAGTLRINLRTLERRFLNETGLSPKQFARIIQFQSSLQQLTLKNYTKLTDIVYENGFADQSHFIKVFKAFTGKTPKTFNIK